MEIGKWHRAFTLYCFGRGIRRGKARKRWTEIVPTSYGFMGWNPDNSHEPGRLPGSGCFTWIGIFAARAAAMEYLAHPEIHQVRIETNQSNPVYIWNKNADGKITGYGYGPDYRREY